MIILKEKKSVDLATSLMTNQVIIVISELLFEVFFILCSDKPQSADQKSPAI